MAKIEESLDNNIEEITIKIEEGGTIIKTEIEIEIEEDKE